MALNSFDYWLRASPDEQPEKVAARALRTRLAKVWKSLKRAAKEGESNPKHVHALRVSTRRANAALELFEDLLPTKRAAWMKKQLGRLRRAAGEARELDVLAERLLCGLNGEGRTKLLARVREQRAAVQKPIIEIHRRLRREEKFERRCRQLIKRTLRRGSDSESRKLNFGDWGRLRLESLTASFLAADATDEWNTKVWHRFRIEAKALRYSLELLAGDFSPQLRTDLYPLVVELQERLGEINDLATTKDALRRGFSKSQLAKSTALREWAHAQHSKLQNAREAFLAWYDAGVRDSLRRGFRRELTENSSRPERRGLC